MEKPISIFKKKEVIMFHLFTYIIVNYIHQVNFVLRIQKTIVKIHV